MLTTHWNHLGFLISIPGVRPPQEQEACRALMFLYINYTGIQTQMQLNLKIEREEKKWFYPPYSSTVKTNVSREFLNILDRHFPKDQNLHNILNRNTVKVSYSTMPNIAQKIAGINKAKFKKHKQLIIDELLNINQI